MQKHEQYTLVRNGFPPLRFKGTIIGLGSTSRIDDTRGTNISIYQTKGGKFIAKIVRWTQWQGESDSTSAKSFEAFSDLIDWLREDGYDGESLGRVSQEAIEDAIKTVPELREHYIEEVD